MSYGLIGLGFVLEMFGSLGIVRGSAPNNRDICIYISICCKLLILTDFLVANSYCSTYGCFQLDVGFYMVYHIICYVSMH